MLFINYKAIILTFQAQEIQRNINVSEIFINTELMIAVSGLFQTKLVAKCSTFVQVTL